MAHKAARPLSPHLGIWKWGPHMLVSILHRVAGDGMAIVGAIVFVWWLVAAASGKEAYDGFMYVLNGWLGGAIGYILGVGLTWAFFQHMFSGLRHFVLDTGAGYDLKTNRTWSIALVTAAPVVTALVWLYIIFVRG